MQTLTPRRPARPIVVRDDRPGRRTRPTEYAPDYVLFACPACGRDHFVTVDACPTPAEAVAEVATAR